MLNPEETVAYSQIGPYIVAFVVVDSQIIRRYVTCLKFCLLTSLTYLTLMLV